MPAGSGATGAACAVPDTAAKIKLATAIANPVRSICLSLFSDVLLVVLGWIGSGQRIASLMRCGYIDMFYSECLHSSIENTQAPRKRTVK
jgi:hypothetical protein